MRRREFIALLGGATTSSMLWPLPARAQQPAMPVIGFLNASDPKGYAAQLAAFLKGLNEAGYVDGHNVAIEYRWAEGQNDRLPALAADLVHRQVAVIAATTTPAALAAKAATAAIPIVFETGSDPVKLGLVPSLNRPGGNVTGATQTNVEVAPKRLELLHEVLPATRVMALLVNPADPTVAVTQSSEVLSAARSLGLELHVLNASTERDFDAVFANLIQLRAGGLVIGGGALFASQCEQLAALTVRHAVPAIYQWREFAAAGGLLSYGSDLADSYRLVGNYTGRILKGEKPADLPVEEATNKVELYINLKTAKALGITFPLALLGRADEVIE
jgi:putative tryptophan/tyrosine transport system substrate-binding protein